MSIEQSNSSQFDNLDIELANINKKFDFDIYDLYNKKARIQTLECLLCLLVKENKPIDNCLTALSYLKSDSHRDAKPKLSIWQNLANSVHEVFAIIGALVVIFCVFKIVYAKPYSTSEAIQQEQLSPDYRVN